MNHCKECGDTIDNTVTVCTGCAEELAELINMIREVTGEDFPGSLA